MNSVLLKEGPFTSKTDCLFCRTNVHEETADYSSVKTDNFAQTVNAMIADVMSGLSKSKAESFIAMTTTMLQTVCSVMLVAAIVAVMWL